VSLCPLIRTSLKEVSIIASFYDAAPSNTCYDGTGSSLQTLPAS
jgi:hypothetical protein